MSLMEPAELIELPPQNALTVFTTEGAIEPYLARVRAAVETFEQPDITTAEGRDEVRRFARRVVTAKTTLEKIGKALADEQKAIPKKIDATRRLIDERLTAWADKVRQPLTDWENKEKARTDLHEQMVRRMVEASLSVVGKDAVTLRHELETTEAIVVDEETCEEYADRYATAKQQAVIALTDALATRLVYEAEQAELARLRRESAERAERDRLEQIKREAEAKAKADADTAVERERAALAAKAADIEAQTQRAVDAARAALLAEQQAAEAARQKQATIEAEAEAKRTADRKHRAQINREAMADLIDAGVGEVTAKAVITLIVKGGVRHCSINY